MQQISYCAFTALWKRTSDEVDEVQRRAMQSFDPEKKLERELGLHLLTHIIFSSTEIHPLKGERLSPQHLTHSKYISATWCFSAAVHFFPEIH